MKPNTTPDFPGKITKGKNLLRKRWLASADRGFADSRSRRPSLASRGQMADNVIGSGWN
ncbi:hypothetical protein [Sinorhizobium meliloti]|uniref:hypothetical protein n=1 Tax=Rhizobium meliloti TaxID=382 RepID=UPI003F13EC90